MKDRALPKSWNVFCDFDNTISTTDVTDSLLEAFALPEWQAVEAEWKAGRIGSRDCMKRQVELLRCDRFLLDAHVATISIDPAFPAFAAYCEKHQMPLSIVSDGIDEVIRLILRRYRLEHLPVYANQLVELGAGRYSLAFPNSQPGCKAGTCKCDIMRHHHARQHPQLFIGDGASDFCAAGKANLVLAKADLIRHCREQRIPHREFASFSDVLQMVPGL